ncbi:DUF1801 domain-containing protein [Pedobacter sp. MC2016-05]|uniref:DUF1801 domain-containing protein n=1 Tax=Pedobacter sp. MC2016-05 TaxID=2994474 RepID=UPI0022457386|nr:DUF1801 domain-containing protein [Pedobacter sp. MC2016-05]MCX2473314.1 DUF1801 domain-containing protein [Pedobacter sp. MC2016-05]
MPLKKLSLNGKAEVDEFINQLNHPYKEEILLLRSIIINANSDITERVKWNAPSFYSKNDMAAFNLRAKGYVQIIFIFYDGKMLEDSSFLQGSWKDRREARFYGVEDIKMKQSALEQFVNNWLSL